MAYLAWDQVIKTAFVTVDEYSDYRIKVLWADKDPHMLPACQQSDAYSEWKCSRP